MKIISLAIALAFAATGAAQAQNMDMQNGIPLSQSAPQTSQTSQTPQASQATLAPTEQLPQPGQKQQQPSPIAAKKLRFMVGMGLTAGGDDIATMEFADGSNHTVHAGGLVAFAGGIDYRFNRHFSMQGNVGIHVDSSTASNGDIQFIRYPIEVIAYVHAGQKWRFGAGLRHVTNVKIKTSGAVGNYDFDLRNTEGALAEVEYQFSPHFGMKLRVVREEYSEKGITSKLDGNHVGLFGNFYF